MHLLIPFAGPLPEFGPQALQGLALRHLASWIAGAGEGERDEGEATSMTPPHERALARALGLPGADGSVPWAAHALRRDGHDPGDLAWGLLTPVHWRLGAEHVTVTDPQTLALDEAGSRALFDHVHDLFEGDGRLLVWGAPLRWYMAHESLVELRTASIDRAIGRNVDHWQGLDPRARDWRRLQSEVQMRLYGAPLNEAREARGELAVNSLWLSGCGVAVPSAGEEPPTVDERLRIPALQGDLAGWQEAWHALDAGPLRALDQRRRAGAPARLTLCGDRAALSWAPGRGTLWQRLGARLRSADPAAVLATL